jgi:dolichol-phosphate mannosyltransferase
MSSGELGRILVFVPCYNCAPQIGRVLAQLDASGDRFAQVLLLDNGSSDGTVDAAIAAAEGMPRLPLVIGRNHDNYNLGGSHKAAFRYAHENGFTHVLVMHGDDQGTVADAFPYLDRGEHLRHDALLGARFSGRMLRGAARLGPSTLHGYSTFRIVGNLVFNTVFSMGLLQRIPDLGSGLNIYGPRVLADRSLERLTEALCYPVSLLVSMLGRGLNVSFFPISWREDDQVSNVKMFSQAMQTLAILKDYRLRREWFLQSDHRAKPRTEYSFDVVYGKTSKSDVPAVG